MIYPQIFYSRYLAGSYAFAHGTMADLDRKPCDMTGYKKVITNGALWYSVAGGKFVMTIFLSSL